MYIQSISLSLHKYIFTIRFNGKVNSIETKSHKNKKQNKYTLYLQENVVFFTKESASNYQSLNIIIYSCNFYISPLNVASSLALKNLLEKLKTSIGIDKTKSHNSTEKSISLTDHIVFSFLTHSAHRHSTHL